MNLRKRIGTVFTAAALVLGAMGCGAQEDKTTAQTSLPSGAELLESSSDNTETGSGDSQTSQENTDAYGNTLTVVASPGAHTEILNMAKVILASDGIDLVIDSDFDDYMMPNILVDGGVYDCNYFQHEEYLEAFNKEQGTDIVSVGKIHFEPLGIYPGTKRSLTELQNGDTITIPRDTANQARALSLLEKMALIELAPGKEMTASVNDVTDNPYGIRIELMDASQVPSAVANSAFVVMNGNYARQALYTVTDDALTYEDPTTEVADRYANIVAVNRGNENDPRVQALVRVLQSDDIQMFMESRFAGSVVPYTGS